MNMKFKNAKALVVGASALAMALVFFGGFGLASLIKGQNSQSILIQDTASHQGFNAVDVAGGTAPATQQDLNLVQAFQNVSRSVADQLMPSVVRIDIEKKVAVQSNPFGSGQGDSPFQFYFNGQPFGLGNQNQQNNQNNQNNGNSDPQSYSYEGGYGSGIIVDQKGNTVYVLTNNHVTADADKLTIKTWDGKTWEGKLVTADKNRDMAVVSFQSAAQQRVAKFGDSSAVRQGDIVYAIGSPYGIQNTITQGIVSAVGRTSSDLPASSGSDIGGFTDYIQTDTAINPGNSGGALVNIAGEVIGVNTWIATRTGENVGLGFAIPGNSAKKVASDIISKGKVEYGWLGVTPSDILDEVRSSMKLDGKAGAFVSNVIKDSPAEKAGILPGDVITSVDSAVIKGGDDLLRTIAGLEANKNVTMGILRDGQTQQVKVTLGLRADNVDKSAYWPGFVVIALTDQIKAQYRLTNDVGSLVVAGVQKDAAASDAGIKNWDVILQVMGKDVKTPGDFYKALAGAAKSDTISVKVKRAAREFTIQFGR